MLTGLLLSLKVFICLRAANLAFERRDETVYFAKESVVRLDTPFEGFGCLLLFLAGRICLFEVFFYQCLIGEIE